MRRRSFLVAGMLAPMASAFAQQRPARIGLLLPFPFATLRTAPSGAVIRRLEELGYRNGAGAVFEPRSSDGVAERYPRLARELVELKCDVIFSLGPEAGVRALREATSTVPIVFLAVDFDPLEKGVVASLRRPGANVTGVFVPTLGLAAKRLEIAQEVMPAARVFLVLADVHTRDQLAALHKAAEMRGARLRVAELGQPPYDYAPAFKSARQAGVQFLLGLGSPVFFAERAKIAAQLQGERVPAVGVSPPFADAGYLLSYGADLAKLGVRSAELIVRILRGAKPADLPVEQADEFELVVNLKTANALNLKIPYSVLARATKVIE